MPAMTRGRRMIVIALVVLTVVTMVVAVLGWGSGSLEKMSWVTGIFSLIATVVAALAGQGRRNAAPPTAEVRRRWNPPRSRSGAGAVLALGGLGATVMALMVLGALAILVR